MKKLILFIRQLFRNNIKRHISPCQLNTPTHLKHKPIFAAPYDKLITYDAGEDARFITVGRAQYDNQSCASVKILRYGESRWSPQSEEIPIHRVLPLAYVLLKSILIAQNLNRHDTIGEQVKVIKPDDIAFFCDILKDHALSDEIKRYIPLLRRLMSEIDFKKIGEMIWK